jgi:uncharacterized protein YcbX
MAKAQLVGHVEALFRYPIKSMAGEALAAAELGWHGIDGDRRSALRRVEERGGNPWLTASKLPELLRYVPLRLAEAPDARPTHVRLPDGRELEINGDELASEIAQRFGRPVQMMRLSHGIFDEANLSLVAAETVAAIAQESGAAIDVRWFRPNVLVRTGAHAFVEDGWVGGALSFGDEGGGPEVNVTQRDLRCAMIGLDPDTAQSDPRVLKAAVRLNDNYAGVYATVIRRGQLAVGQAVWLHTHGDDR